MLYFLEALPIRSEYISKAAVGCGSLFLHILYRDMLAYALSLVKPFV
eukprot:SAG31_NODE_6910_length_1853_cov_6.956455_2_plen_47_part_00